MAGLGRFFLLTASAGGWPWPCCISTSPPCASPRRASFRRTCRGGADAAVRRATKTFFAGRLGKASAVLLLLATGAWLARQTLDVDTRTRLRANCFCRRGLWRECLDELRRAAPGRVFRGAAVRRQSGAVRDGATARRDVLLPAKTRRAVRPRRRRRIRGRVMRGPAAAGLRERGRARGQRMAGDCRPVPPVLRRLATIYIAKGCPDAAKVFLERCARTSSRDRGPKPAWPAWNKTPGCPTTRRSAACTR